MEIAGVNLVIGTKDRAQIVEMVEQYDRANGVENHVSDIMKERVFEPLSIQKLANRTRAYLKIQDGCSQYCSYCIIPYARGRVRSRRKEEVVEEVKTLAGNGCKEVVLTGIHLSSYGIDHGSTLQELILAVHEVAGVERIRLGSLEPGIITEDFVKTLSALPKFCPHFHLSLQSGCDATLKRMNRRYTSGEYYEKCILIRKYFKHPALTTDVIVGFPGETEEEFAITRDFLNKVDFYETHIFQYSRRKGTKAAVMENQVPSDVAHRRSAILIADGKVRKQRFEEKISETVTKVLFEESVTIDGKVYASGHTMEYIRMLMETTENLDNQILLVKAGKERCQDCLLCTKARS